MTERLPFHFSLSCIGEGNGNPLLCSCLENPRDGGAWWTAIYGVAQSRTWLKRLSSSSSMLSRSKSLWPCPPLRLISSVQSLSHVWLFATPWITAHQASLSITNYRSSLKLMSIKLVMPSSHLILCGHLLLLPPIPPSIRVFSSESTLHMRWQSIGVSASASVLPMNTQDWSPLAWTGWISLQFKGLSVSSPPQFKSINSLALSFLHSPTLTSIYDHWKNQSLD